MRTRNGRKYPVPHASAAFQAFKKTAPSEIHAVYEQRMFEVDAPALLASVNTRLQQQAPAAPAIATGHEAATALIEMMHGAHQRLSPTDIIEADDPTLKPKARAEHLWNNNDIRDATVASLADSVRLLARLWETAWQQGGGNQLPQNAIRTFSEAKLSGVYRHEHDTFVPSMSLDEMAQSGSFEPA